MAGGGCGLDWIGWDWIAPWFCWEMWFICSSAAKGKTQHPILLLIGCNLLQFTLAWSNSNLVSNRDIFYSAASLSSVHHYYLPVSSVWDIQPIDRVCHQQKYYVAGLHLPLYYKWLDKETMVAVAVWLIQTYSEQRRSLGSTLASFTCMHGGSHLLSARVWSGKGGAIQKGQLNQQKNIINFLLWNSWANARTRNRF